LLNATYIVGGPLFSFIIYYLKQTKTVNPIVPTLILDLWEAIEEDYKNTSAAYPSMANKDLQREENQEGKCKIMPI